ncbi:DUF3422 family protein [Rubritepida flocculans]|uniref:DUF3422 family protein n=1 Tax=Rubritepida flocculans TaxID=182403 RepID=UPI000417CCB0|nr:DUF3422 domain-containing protein [Rubritepida flocculans]
MSFPSHPQREALTGELHARPAVPIKAPARLSRLAMVAPDRAAEEAHLAALCAWHGVAPPAPGATWFMADFGAFRLRFERHTEFTGWNFLAAGADPERPFDSPAIAALPPEWLARLPGQAVAALHIALVDARVEQCGFVGDSIAGAAVADQAAMVFTDFRLHPDGFTRILIAGEPSPVVAGRLAQALWEIETYRAMALLALPVARGVGPQLASASEQLARISARLPSLDDLAAERAALEELTAVAGEIERASAATAERFSASAAYHRLVLRRLAELGEVPLHGIPTLSRFLDRRMEPAMATVSATGARIAALSVRAARLVDLLRARVAVAQEAQAEKQLATLAATGRAQLRLQQTVEGLSVAGITYYLLTVIGYLIKPLPWWRSIGTTAEQILAVLVPVVAALVWLNLRKRRLEAEK